MDSKIQQATSYLRAGDLVAIPTETVYGLGGNALSDAAVAKIYAAKNRPVFNPLIVHVDSLQTARHYAQFDESAEKLAEKFWPGPLTLVLPRKKNCPLSLLVSAGMENVAIRIPSHPLALELLAFCKLPVAAPSANRSGKISPTSPAHVLAELVGHYAMILDGGDCIIGIESTVVDMSTDVPMILRPGFVTQENIQSILNKSVSMASDHSDIKSPGMLKSHYAPDKKIRLNAAHVEKDEALLAFGKAIEGAKTTENLSPSGNLQEAAANLFRMLRLLDASSAKSIAVMPIPHKGLGIALNDRLQRAASPHY